MVSSSFDDPDHVVLINDETGLSFASSRSLNRTYKPSFALCKVMENEFLQPPCSRRQTPRVVIETGFPATLLSSRQTVPSKGSGGSAAAAAVDPGGRYVEWAAEGRITSRDRIPSRPGGGRSLVRWHKPVPWERRIHGVT